MRRKSDGIDLEANERFCDNDEPPRTKSKLGKSGEKEKIEELANFGESLRKADIVCIDVERKRIQARARGIRNGEGGEKNLQHQREGRRAREKLEIEKFKLMMAAFCHNIDGKKVVLSRKKLFNLHLEF